MSRAQKDLAALRNNPRGVRFVDLLRVLKAQGFTVDRVTGSHHVLKHSAAPAIRLTLQPKGDMALEYQVKQALAAIDEVKALEAK